MGLDTQTSTGLREGSFKRALQPADAVGTEAAFRAWCLSDGVIFYGTELPDGAIEIVRGDESLVRETLDVAARHGYKPGVLLVPGVPEAEDQREGLIALHEWINWFARHPIEGGSVLDWNLTLKDRA